MVTEIAMLYIRKHENNDFEQSFAKAEKIIASMKGYIEHELMKCMEQENKYLLIVRWQKLEDHTEGFRKSEKYNERKNLLHHYYDPFPVAEHYMHIN